MLLPIIGRGQDITRDTVKFTDIDTVLLYNRSSILANSTMESLKSQNYIEASYLSVELCDVLKILDDSLFQAVAVQKRDEIIDILISKSKYHDNLGEYTAKIEVDTVLLNHISSIDGNENPKYIFLLDDLTQTYIYTYDYYNALKTAEEALYLREKVFGKTHRDYGTTLANIAFIHFNLANYAQSYEFSLQSLEVIEKTVGKESSLYISSLDFLVAALSTMGGDRNKALELNLEILNLTKKTVGKEDVTYVEKLLNVANSYYSLNKKDIAFKYTQDAFSILEKTVGKNNYAYVLALARRGAIELDESNFNKAIKTHLEAVEISENLSSVDLGHNDYYLIALNNLATTYLKSNYLEQAIEIFEQIIEIIRTNRTGYNKMHEINAISSLYNLYSDFGDYNKAHEISLEAFQLAEQSFSNQSNFYLTALNNLAISYLHQGDYNRSIELHLKALSIKEKLYGTENKSYALSLSNLSQSYSYLGEYDKALEISIESFSIKEKLYKKEDIEYANRLSDLAASYFWINDYNKSKELNLNAIDIFQKLLPKDHPSYVSCLDNLAYTYRNLDDFESSYYTFQKVNKSELSRLKYIETFANPKLYQDIIASIRYRAHQIMNLALKLNSSLFLKQASENIAFLKGRELQNENYLKQLIFKTKDDRLLKMYSEWEAIHKKINSIYEASITEHETLKINLNDLENRAEYLERKLVSNIDFHKTESASLFQKIETHLKDEEVYVDVLNINKIDYESDQHWTLSTEYYASTFKKTDTIPRLIYLGSDSYLDSIYNYYYSYTEERPSNNEFSYRDIVYGNICYENFWSKLDPYLEGVSTVYFSPEGVYSKINPNVLYDSTSNSFLMDKYDIIYVSNVDDFVHQKENIQLYERPDDLHAVLIGNPTFLLEEDVVVLASNESTTRSISQDDLYSLQRGMLLSDLPGTQTEIDLISDNLKSKGWDVELISGVEATETRVKSLEAPKILHIATHGFFFEDQEMVKRSNMISTDNKKAVSNPMTRSGLIFSGGENTMNGEMLAYDNGWLNSYEASLLNLRGTELVVLSACNTGSGDVQNGKGVYGLQRAIRVAGAESLIMSMWEVDDKATQELMTYFYDYWIDKNMTKKDAFNKAQEKIREKYKHPYYWGAFIMIGK